MKTGRLLQATTFRLALLYMVLFATSVMILLGFIYWTTMNYMERQTDETIHVEIQGLAEQYTLLGLAGVMRVVNARSSGAREGGLYLLTDFLFRPLAGNLKSWPEIETSDEGFVNTELVNSEGDTRYARFRHFRLTHGFHLLVGRDITERINIHRLLLRSVIWGLGITFLLALFGGVVLSRGMIRRLDAINRTGREIIQGDLSRRVPVTGSGDEFDKLAVNLNNMLDRIEQLMAGIRQVSDNIAHDMRTPLTRVRNHLEQARSEPPEILQATLDQSLVDIDGLLKTFNALLRIAKAEAGSGGEEMGPVDLTALTSDMVDLYEPLAEDKEVSFHSHLEEATVFGNRHLLSQAVANLLDNAVKYTPRGRSVEFYLTCDAGAATLVVADTGPGIPEEYRDKVLERFFRLEQSRSTPGSGLGLSLVSAVAELHKAKLELQDNKPGLRVVMTFPPVS